MSRWAVRVRYTPLERCVKIIGTPYFFTFSTISDWFWSKLILTHFFYLYQDSPFWHMGHFAGWSTLWALLYKGLRAYSKFSSQICSEVIIIANRCVQIVYKDERAMLLGVFLQLQPAKWPINLKIVLHFLKNWQIVISCVQTTGQIRIFDNL